MATRKAQQRPRHRKKWRPGRRKNEPDDANGSTGEFGTVPTSEEVERWASDERRRREAWLNGPTDAEVRQYMEDQRGNPGKARQDHRIDEAMRTLRLLLEGANVELFRAPFAILERFVHAGEDWERRLTSSPGKTRIFRPRSS
jgi:hypothetical protein